MLHRALAGHEKLGEIEQVAPVRLQRIAGGPALGAQHFEETFDEVQSARLRLAPIFS